MRASFATAAAANAGLAFEQNIMAWGMHSRCTSEGCAALTEIELPIGAPLMGNELALKDGGTSGRWPSAARSPSATARACPAALTENELPIKGAGAIAQ